ncbi:WD40 repeat domain-containing protein [Deinococcus aestuarii]|uniref:WD40 repeat domain-containing protein n=1 Tax=Deinococcus aestuarii TaxID=2774531 RepID=UPI001C0B2DED|nr:WD40 repeat domain-containing protein [Deinococcus aestuarii]
MARPLLLATLLMAMPTSALAQAAPVTFDLVRTVQTPSLGAGPLALSPDGRTLTMNTSLGWALFDARTLRQKALAAMDTRRFPAPGIQFSPEGERILSDVGGTAAFDARTGRNLWHAGEGRAAFSPDGERVYLASPTGALAVLDARTGQVVRGKPEPADSGSVEYYRSGAFYNRPVSFAVHPAGKVLASGSFGGGIVLWNAETGEKTGTLTDQPTSSRPTRAALAGKTAHGGQVTALTFAPDGTLVSGANDGTVKRWDPETGQKLGQALLPDGVQAVALLPGSKGVLVASGTNVVKLGLPDLRRERVFVGHADRVSSLALSGDTLWTSSADGTVKRWSLRSGLDEATYGKVKTAAVSPDGQTFALNLGDTTVRLTDAHGKTLRTLRGFLPPRTFSNFIGGRSFAFSPDGQTLAGGITTMIRMTIETYSAASQVYLWDVAGGRVRRVLEGMPGDDLTFSPDGQQLLGVNNTGGQVPAYGVRRVADGRVIASPCQPYLPNGQATGAKCPPEEVRGVSWVGNRAYRITLGQAGGPTSPALVRDVLTGGVRVSLGKLWNNGPAMGLSPDGRRVVSLAGNGLRLWDGQTGQALRVWPEFTNPFPYRGGPILFSPDGKTVTYPGPDLRLHDTATGRLLGEQKGAGEVVGFLRGGRSLVTVNERGVQLWHVRAGK